LIDTNNDNKVSEEEVASAIAILEKSKKDKEFQNQKNALDKFQYYVNDNNINNSMIPQ
jgi:hypothetical protein